jgi:hypothetical protein
VQKLNKLRIITTPNISSGGFHPDFEVICKGCVVYSYQKCEKIKKFELVRNASYIDLEISQPLLVTDDV